MKERLLTGWTLQRFVFIILGGIMLTQGYMEQQWIGIALGAYFFLMGLFAFGCATRGCFSGNCNTSYTPNNLNKNEEIEFEEIKNQ